jgi:trimethylamine---corrinoid protein Co-methyltransferase
MLGTPALVQMARDYYGLPTWGYSGCSDSKAFDEQSAIEGALWVMMAAMSGTNVAHDVGYLESGMTCSFEQIAAMDETIGLVNRMMGGIEFNEETMALGLIDEVGPGGQFLTTQHTLSHFKENWYPRLFDKHAFQSWECAGKKTMSQRTSERVRYILGNHLPSPIRPQVLERLDTIIRCVEQEG